MKRVCMHRGNVHAQKAVADLRGGARDANSFNFMQFSGKYGKIVCWRPPGELVPPPRENPGSATEKLSVVHKDFKENLCAKITVTMPKG